MSVVDYEAEYNNRARVPQHKAIFADWARDASAYRESVDSRHESLSYGATERQVVDLFDPESAGSGATAMFIHGGYWQSLDRSSFSHMARGLNGHGIRLRSGYDLCSQVRISDIVEQIRRACLRLADRGPVVVSGHSAGGHLGLHACDRLAHARRRAGSGPGRLRDLRPVRPQPLVATSINTALAMTEPDAERLSPLGWSRRPDA